MMYSSRNMVPNMVFAVSFMWQQKKPNMVMTAAGSSRGQFPQSSSTSGKNASIFTIAMIQVMGDRLVYRSSRHMSTQKPDAATANTFLSEYSMS